MSPLEKHLEEKLESRKREGLFRQLPSLNFPFDFSSNDYLGLARSHELATIVNEKTATLQIKNGATGSRLLSGNSSMIEALEAKLADIFLSQSTLIFNSGYAANLGVLSTIPGKNDTIIYDELAHACIKDGARLSMANRFSFRHNDLGDLERKIKKSSGTVFVAVESIYSMDGDECPLNELVELCDRYGCEIILDEAHTTGSIGNNGSGLAVTLNVASRIGFRIYTFGKAIGAHGACVACSDTVKAYLINYARPFIYTTALPPHTIITVSSAFDYIAAHPDLQQLLRNNIDRFTSAVSGMDNRVKSNSSIQTAIFPGNANVKAVCAQLQEKGFDVRPILSPTVPMGGERLRICLHAYNDFSEIDSLSSELLKFK